MITCDKLILNAECLQWESCHDRATQFSFDFSDRSCHFRCDWHRLQIGAYSNVIAFDSAEELILYQVFSE